MINGGTRKSSQNFNFGGIRNSFSLNDPQYKPKFSITGNLLSNNSVNRPKPSYSINEKSNPADVSKHSSTEKRGENVKG